MKRIDTLESRFKKLGMSKALEINIDNCLDPTLFKGKANIVCIALNLISQMFDEPKKDIIERVLSQNKFNEWQKLFEYLMFEEFIKRIKEKRRHDIKQTFET